MYTPRRRYGFRYGCGSGYTTVLAAVSVTAILHSFGFTVMASDTDTVTVTVTATDTFAITVTVYTVTVTAMVDGYYCRYNCSTEVW